MVVSKLPLYESLDQARYRELTCADKGSDGFDAARAIRLDSNLRARDILLLVGRGFELGHDETMPFSLFLFTKRRDSLGSATKGSGKEGQGLSVAKNPCRWYMYKKST
jgi:hypothetical protein